jgi:ribosomal protein S18 acetylase RimI-like enzyme
MATSPHCFGYVAVDDDEVVGVVVGTTESEAVFRELIWRRGLHLVGPVLGALLRHPGLICQIVETFLYPSQMETQPGEAELLFIGTRATRRGEGIGGALFDAVLDDCRRRGMTAMGLTVDDANETAKRFYRRRGMQPGHTVTLYGRTMHWYRLTWENAL